ncbi:MAG: hypothetical protein R2765_05590 [Ferruginibacter sp.]
MPKNAFIYTESLSAYARQFIQRMNKPDVDYIKAFTPPSPSNKSNNPYTTQYRWQYDRNL